MKRSALPWLSLALAACTSISTERPGERVASTQDPFTSVQAVLLDFELDGRLVADTTSEDKLRTLITTQLMFTVGQLNGESSVGQLAELEVSGIWTRRIPDPPPPDPPPPPPAPEDAGAPEDGGVEPPPPPPPPPPPRWEVGYHAKLPVAWGGGAAPERYTFTLPASLSSDAQTEFATRYGTTCVDPSAGSVSAGRMFLFYRPRQAGCALDAGDVVSFTASVTRSAENTTGKYPEYHRVWKDGALEVVAVFSRELFTPQSDDEGVWAYLDFVRRVDEYLTELQPDVSKRRGAGRPPASVESASDVTLGAELPDGRTMAVHARLVGPALSEETTFDAWYDARTPTADVILYNGHAGLGDNIRALMDKGTFRAGQYVIWFANGCDTLAYVDRRLAERRAELNPDDPTGTKYMDTVTNVLGGYFRELDATSMIFLHALVEVRDPKVPPKTYEQVFTKVDPTQVIVVTGEQDNQLEPIPPSPNPPSPPGAGQPSSPAATPGVEEPPNETPAVADDGGGPAKGGDGCGVAARARAGASNAWIIVALGLAAGWVGARRRVRLTRRLDRAR